MTPEGKVKKKVDEILKRAGAWYFKPVSAGYGTHGIPDYIACIRGRFLGVECKGTDAGKPTELQAACLDAIAEHGGVIFVATPSSLATLESIITLLKNDASCP